MHLVPLMTRPEARAEDRESAGGVSCGVILPRTEYAPFVECCSNEGLASLPLGEDSVLVSGVKVLDATAFVVETRELPFLSLKMDDIVLSELAEPAPLSISPV